MVVTNSNRTDLALLNRRSIWAIVVAMLALVIGAAPAWAITQTASQDRAEQIEAAFVAAVPDASGPGAVVLVSRGDEVVFSEARGAADLVWGVPLAPSQTFAIASVTKTFTAAAILKLVEDHRLSLDDTLSTYVPEFRDTSGITIRQLLSHTAGVSDRAILSEGPPGFLRQDISLADLVQQIASQPSDFAPGSRQRYSNAGYILLGAVLEKVTESSWHRALSDLVIAPAGLHETSYAPVSRIIPGRVSGYTTDGPDRGVANADYISLSVPASAGGLVSTAPDLRAWMRSLVRGDIVSSDVFQQMTTPVVPALGPSPNPYGFGFYVWSIRGEAMVGHTGQINGFTSMLGYLPAQDVTFVVLANNDGFDAQTLGRRLAAIMVGKPYDLVTPGGAESTDLSIFTGTFGEGDNARTFSVKDRVLHSRRGEGPRENPMMVSAGGNLHFDPDELSFFAPVRDASGSVVALDYYARGEGAPMRLMRTH